MAIGRPSLFRVGLITATSVTASFFLIVWPPLLREFTRAALEGDRFRRYYQFFLPALWLLLVVFTMIVRRKDRAIGIWRWIVAGALAGYLSGILSGVAFDLLHPGGWNLMLRNSLSAEGWVMRLGYPLIALNWLVGVLAACLESTGLRWMRPSISS